MITKRKPMAIALDADDTLVDWIGGFCNYHNKLYGTTVDGHKAPGYDLSAWLGINREVMQDRMNDFNHSWEFGCLEPMRYAVDVIHYLQDYNETANDEDRIHIIVLSKCGSDDVVRNLRLANLEGVFGANCFDEVTLIDPHMSKQPYLQAIQDEYNLLIFVDDYVGNCNEADAIGVKSVVIQRSHNKHLKERNPHLHFCRDWMHLLSVHIARFIRVE